MENHDEAARYVASGSETAQSPSFDAFVHRKTEILNTKLEILAFEINARLHIRVWNLKRIGDQKVEASQMLEGLCRQCNYLMREHRDKRSFYEQLFKLEDVECWRDVVMVMRDFLYVWEAHELAKRKAMFLDRV